MYVLELSDMAGYGGFNGFGSPPFLGGPDTVETWTPVTGLFEFTVTRSGPARPGTFEAIYMATDVPLCGTPASPRQRFRLRDDSVTTDQNRDIIMVGRLDDVEPVQDSQYGRCLRVKGRDYLGALADNHIDVGLNWVAGPTFDGLPPVGGLVTSCGAVASVPWIPNWVGFVNGLTDGAGQSLGLGEMRGFIIAQLATNILGYKQGILWVTDTPMTGIGTSWPNSKPIEVNYQDAVGYTILDAIRNLALSDPWSDTSVPVPPVGAGYMGAYVFEDCGAGSVSGAPCVWASIIDARDIVNASLGQGWPDAGIGGEFQIDYYTAGFGPACPGVTSGMWQRNGHFAAYYRRGNRAWDPNIIFKYGGLQGGGGKVLIVPIISYDLPQLGSDIYSRGSVLGSGEARYAPPAPTYFTGTGKIIPAAEDTWDPANGLYAAQRDIIDFDQGLVGDWTHEMLPDSANYKSRALRDAAYANLFAGNQTLARLRGSMAGSITVPYFPRNVGGFPLVPGETILLEIDHLALLKQMVIDNWSYKWPANEMTLTVSRNPLRGFGSQIVKGVRRTEQLIATAGNFCDMGWWRTDGTGSHRWRHNKGVIPKKVSVQVAQNSAQADALGRAIPMDGTVVAMGQGLSFSPADGQWAGYITTELTDQYVTLRYSINVTYDDGNACGWLLDGSCLLRVIVEG